VALLAPVNHIDNSGVISRHRSNRDANGSRLRIAFLRRCNVCASVLGICLISEQRITAKR
jgi:hypothetical protein